jgi:mono/diheme cytochrome c family protein
LHDRDRVNRHLVIQALLILVVGAPPAGADLTGPYAGQVVVKRPPQTLDVAAALTQTGRTVAGTVALGGSSSFDGPYVVSGSGGARKFRVMGTNATGTRLVWRGIVTAGGTSGRIKLRGQATRLKGKLTLARRTSVGTGESCDAVFTQNQEFFTGQIMDAVLAPICAACHVPGGQAQATRLTVMRGDPLATARSVALLIDAANPADSLLVRKPTAAVPHGGGQQVLPGSPAAQALEQWATLVTQAACQGAGGSDTSLFAADCGSCHGSEGAGGTTGPDVRCAAPSLLADAVRHGRGTVMPRMAISDTDLQTIRDYLDARCSHRPEDIYVANCARCHGATAGGGRNADGTSGPNIRCSDEFAEALREGPDRMPAFPSFKATEVTRLGAWVRGFCGLGGGGDD